AQAGQDDRAGSAAGVGERAARQEPAPVRDRAARLAAAQSDRQAAQARAARAVLGRNRPEHLETREFTPDPCEQTLEWVWFAMGASPTVRKMHTDAGCALCCGGRYADDQQDRVRSVAVRAPTVTAAARRGPGQEHAAEVQLHARDR